MAYNFGLLTNIGWVKARQWLKGGIGTYSNGKPPVDDADDNNYQNYADNAAATGAIATFKQTNTLNQFEINSGHTLIDNALTLNAVSAPATPTVAFTGTAGSTTYTYKVVGRAGMLQAPSAGGSVTTGNATLSASASNYNTITFVPTPGFHAYDIYRTVGGSSQGIVGTVTAGFGPNVATPTLTFVDNGIVADGSTVPATNSTGGIAGDAVVWGNLTVNALATPAAPLVTPNGSGATTWAYEIVARSGSPTTPTGHTAHSTAGQTTAAPATINSTATGNVLRWQAVPGAVSYDVYRTTAGTSPSTTGKIANVVGVTYTDIGAAGDSSSAPTTNTTGVINGGAGEGEFSQVLVSQSVGVTAPSTLRLTDSELTVNYAGSVSSSGSLVGVRGNVIVASGTTLAGIYIYGTQGKVTLPGTLNNTGGQYVAGVLAQLDTSAMTALTSGQLCALWCDMGATSTIVSSTSMNICILNNTTNTIINSCIQINANATYLFDISDLAYGGAHFVKYTTASTAAGCLVCHVGGNVRYLQLYSSAV